MAEEIVMQSGGMLTDRELSGLPMSREEIAWRLRSMNLEDLNVDSDSALTFAPGEPFRESHRHFSHAMAIHPLGILNSVGELRDRAIIESTLDSIHAEGSFRGATFESRWMVHRILQAIAWVTIVSNTAGLQKQQKGPSNG